MTVVPATFESLNTHSLVEKMCEVNEFTKPKRCVVFKYFIKVHGKRNLKYLTGTENMERSLLILVSPCCTALFL